MRLAQGPARRPASGCGKQPGSLAILARRPIYRLAMPASAGMLSQPCTSRDTTGPVTAQAARPGAALLPFDPHALL